MSGWGFSLRVSKRLGVSRVVGPWTPSKVRNPPNHPNLKGVEPSTTFR